MVDEQGPEQDPELVNPVCFFDSLELVPCETRRSSIFLASILAGCSVERAGLSCSESEKTFGKQIFCGSLIPAAPLRCQSHLHG